MIDEDMAARRSWAAAEPTKHTTSPASRAGATSGPGALVTAPGLVAVLAAAFMGAAWWGPVVAALCYAAAIWTPRALGAVLFLAGPLVLSTALPFDSLFAPSVAVHLLVAAAATWPFFLHVGRAVPWRWMPFYAGVATAVAVAAFYLTPFDVHLVLTSSDITARAQTLVLLIAVLAAELGAWWWRRRAQV